MASNQNVDVVEKKKIPKYTMCPQCNHKGLYHVNHKYYRCRYCGHSRLKLYRQEIDQ